MQALGKAATIEEEQAKDQELVIDQIALLEHLQASQGSRALSSGASGTQVSIPDGAAQAAPSVQAAAPPQVPSGHDHTQASAPLSAALQADARAVLEDEAEKDVQLPPGYHTSADLHLCMNSHFQAVLQGLGGVELQHQAIDTFLTVKKSTQNEASYADAQPASSATLKVQLATVTNVVHAARVRDAAVYAQAAATASTGREPGKVEGLPWKQWTHQHLNVMPDGSVSVAR